jgi:acyl carrier protein
MNDPTHAKKLITCSLILTLISSAACFHASQSAEPGNPNTVETNPKDILRNKIEGKLNQMFAVQFGVGADKVKPETRLVEDLKADELDLVEMIMRVEEGFEIVIPDEDTEKLKRVGDFYDYVEKLVNEKLKT